MINTLHLLWIIPLAAWFGYCTAAILAVGGRSEKKDEPYWGKEKGEDK